MKDPITLKIAYGMSVITVFKKRKNMNTPPTTPTTLERKKLTNEASGAIFAPAKKGSFFDENRQILIDQHVQQVLDNRAQQNAVQHNGPN